jgi:hypothetical protein
MNREAQRSLAAIPGKTIAHVIAAEGRSVPAQLFLVFTDATYCELYSQCSIDAGPRLYDGDRAAVKKLTQGNQKVIFDSGDR